MRDPGAAPGHGVGASCLPPVCILCPVHEAFAHSWSGEFNLIKACLEGVGLTATPLLGSQDPPRGSVTLALLTWGYHLASAEWVKRLERWEQQGACIFNPVNALRWNTTKTYLKELEAAGVPIVPTVVLQAPTSADFSAAQREFGSGRIVVKPLIGACAYGTTVSNNPDELPDHPVLLQPFCPEVVSEGELSLIYFGGKFSHAVCKRPADGDFRVQAEHAGTAELVSPPAAAVRVAEMALAAAPQDLLYARIDLIADRPTSYRLMELELIEPQLFLDLDADAGRRFGRALLERLIA